MGGAAEDDAPSPSREKDVSGDDSFALDDAVPISDLVEVNTRSFGGRYSPTEHDTYFTTCTN